MCEDGRKQIGAAIAQW